MYDLTPFSIAYLNINEAWSLVNDFNLKVYPAGKWVYITVLNQIHKCSVLKSMKFLLLLGKML